jgi:signal transduction histidine kinase
MTLRKRLSLILLSLTLTLLLAMTGLYYFEMRRVLEQEVIDRLQVLTDLKSDRIYSFVNRLKSDVATSPDDLDMRRMLPLLSRLMDVPVSHDNPEMIEAFNRLIGKWRVSGEGDLLLADQNGRLVYVGNPDDRARYLDEGPPGPWRKTVEKGRVGFTLSDIFRLPEEEEKGDRFALYAAGPIYNVEGQFLGTVVIQAGAEHLFSIVQNNIGLGKTGETELVGQEDGEALILSPLRHDPDAALTRKIPFGGERDIPAQQAVTGYPNSGRFTDYRGVETVAVFRYIPVEGKRWGIVSKIDWNEALLPMERLFYLLIFLGGGAALVTTFVVLTTVHFLVIPIQFLQAGARRLGGGDLDYRVGLVRSDEIGDLAVAFDQMADSLSAAQGALKQRADELTHSNADLSSFSYSVSHDLRSPLRAIEGFAAILTQDHESQLNADARHCIDVIRKNIKQMNQLIDGLLTFSRLGHQPMLFSTVDMEELARFVADEFKLTMQERALQITIHSLPPAQGDRILLHQVWVNLIGNAIKYTGPRPIGIIEVGAHREGDHNRYYVKDNGVGFDMRFVSQLFKVFQRLHTVEEFEGTGVGLALVERLMYRHGGRVWAEGKVNEGATFYFTLPGEKNSKIDK